MSSIIDEIIYNCQNFETHKRIVPCVVILGKKEMDSLRGEKELKFLELPQLHYLHLPKYTLAVFSIEKEKFIRVYGETLIEI